MRSSPGEYVTAAFVNPDNERVLEVLDPKDERCHAVIRSGDCSFEVDLPLSCSTFTGRADWPRESGVHPNPVKTRHNQPLRSMNNEPTGKSPAKGIDMQANRNKSRVPGTHLLLALPLALGLLCSLPPVLCAEPSGTPSPVVKQPDLVQGPFKPSWESLANYRVPEWFSEAKFGIWAHWGPQCVPEVGDWYARSMYESGTLQPDGSVKDVSRNYESHVKQYGHPSKVGFKDICQPVEPR